MSAVEREFLKGTREAVAVRWHLPAHAAEVMVIFGFPHGADATDFLWWRSYDDGSITLHADCSDVFAWGSADNEVIEEKDMPLLRQCFDDLSAIGRDVLDNIAALYAARKRGVVPMPKFMERIITDERAKRLFTEERA